MTAYIATWTAILRLQTHSPEGALHLINSLQQLTNLLWCVEEIVMVKPDLGTLFIWPKLEKYLSLVKTSPMRQRQTILMLAQWQLYTVSLETCMSDQGLSPYS